MKGWDENQLGRPWNGMQPLFSAVIWYLKGSIQALDPQLVHVGVGNVIDQLHLIPLLPRSDHLSLVPPLVIDRAQDHFMPFMGPCSLYYIRVTVL